MAVILFYLLEVVACSALFAGCYWLVLCHSRFYQWNRFYILAAMALSVVIPMLDIPVTLYHRLSVQPDYVVHIVVDPAEVVATSTASSFSWGWFLFAVCMCITFLFVLKEVISVIRIISLKQKCEHIHTPEADLYCTDDETAPFTFFRTIFWKKGIPVDSSEGRCMLHHELAHAHLGHSWDKALMQLVCCVFWMNPFFMLLRRELELVHEFSADSQSIGEGNTEELSSLILCTLYPNHYHDFTSRFFQSSIKRRIAMITDNKKSSMSLLRKMSVVPVVLIALYLFACKSDKQPAGNDKSESDGKSAIVLTTPDSITPTEDNDNQSDESDELDGQTIFAIVDKMPLFNGKPAEEGFREYVNKNTNYPQAAQDKGISGRVFVEFVIDSKGNLRNAKIARNIDPSLDEEALRVIRSSPQWTPGYQRKKAVPVRYTFPIVFKLNNEPSQARTKVDVKIVSNEAGENQIFTIVEDMPLFNGKPAEEGFRDYVNKKTQYPPAALKSGISGRVFIEFCIDKDGAVKDAKVIRSADPDLDAEALRVINSSPKWTPGKEKGKVVVVKYTFPVVFKLNN